MTRRARRMMVGWMMALGAAAVGATVAAQPPNSMMAEDVFKNVQALKGIGVDDFMLTMGIMSAAVGSDCVGCHPSAGMDQVDWARDTPRKRTARRMVQMVAAINRDHFNGRQVVTCWSCHRGRDRPVTTMTLDTVYGPPNEDMDDQLPAAQGGASVDQVLNKYLTAIGGAANVGRVTTFVATGKSVGYRGFGGDGRVELSAQAPDRRAVHITFPEYPDRGTSVRTYDGRTGWIATPLAVVPKYELSGSEKDGARIDAMLSFPSQIRQALTNLHVGPPATIADQDMTVLQGSGPNGTLATLYFDDKTGLLVRMVRHGRSPIGRVPTQVDYSDYRDVGGIKFPYRWTFAWLDGRDTFEFSDVKVNVPIDPSTFGEPKVAPAKPAADADFDREYARLRQGRAYSRDVPRGVVAQSYRRDGGEYHYVLNVPEQYDPTRKYPVRVQLHGGVGRIETSAPPRAGPGLALTAYDHIDVAPAAWRDAPWWNARQIDNLHAILDRLKETYNIDENRIVLSGVSDGGTGAYYAAMRDTTPFAGFVALNGFIAVLKNETTDADGDLFPHNLLNKPLFVVNGGRDPMYPTALVDPYVAQLRRGGVDVTYRPQPDAGHDPSWWPRISGAVATFIADRPRRPLPDSLTWECGPPVVPCRAHWLVIERLGGDRGGPAALPDVNAMATPPAPDFGIRASGTRVNRVARGSNAEQIGLKAGDVIETINNQPLPAGADVSELLRGFPSGGPLLLTMKRGGAPVRVTGRYAPAAIAGESEWMFPRRRESGRVDLERTGNRVEAAARGVGAFTLLLSPDQFDFSKPVTIVVNGKTVYAAPVAKRVDTLRKWAARDNDRTMLFGAELRIEPP